MNGPTERIPVILLTGFLGSGKTTLLRRALLGEHGADVAVLVNELGAVGLDHHLLWSSAGTVAALENGCVCCALRDDLVSCLEDLFWRRLRRTLPRFQRVVVETTGLADPRHVIDALGNSSLVRERYRLAAVVVTVDARAAVAQRARHPEWSAQVELADRLLLTKTDVAKRAEATAVRRLLAKTNPLATVHDAPNGVAAPDLVFGDVQGAEGWRKAGLRSRFRAETGEGPHDPQARTILIQLAGPVDLERLAAALRDAASRLGDRLLRVKGVVEARGRTGALIVQAVGKNVSPPEAAADWRGPAGWLVFIVRGVAREEIAESLAGVDRPPAA